MCFSTPHRPKVKMDTVSTSKSKLVDSIFNIAQLTNSGLDRNVVLILYELIDSGIDPESLVEGYNYNFHTLYLFL